MGGRWRRDWSGPVFDDLDEAVAELFAQPGIAVGIDDQSVVGMGAAADASFERVQGEAAAGRVGANARTERVIEPDAAVGRGCDAGDMDAAIAPGRTIGGWHAVLMDTGAGIVHRLPDDKLTDLAGPAFAPPDVAPVVKGNQVRRIVVRRGRDVLLDASAYSPAGAWKQAPDAMNLVVVLGKPDGAGQGVRAGDAVGVALGRGRWE